LGRGDIRNIVLVISITGSFLTAFLGSSVNVALPLIGKDLSADTVMLTWINTSYLLATTIFLIPFGRLSDIYGRKKIYLYGILVFTISSLLCGLSNSYIFLILTRVLQGIGAGMLFATSTAILTSVFPVGERGKALGLSVTAVYIGLSAGPFLGGILTRCLGWRSIFFSSVFIGVITLLLILLRLKEEWIEAKGEKFNLPESILYSATLAGVIYGFARLPSITGLFLILLGIIGFLIFLVVESRREDPILDIKLFTNNRVFTLSNFSALISYSATSAIAYLLSLYLQYIKGLDPQNTGIILVFQPVMQAIFSPIAGRLSDKFQPGLVASLGMFFTTLGLFLLRFIDANTSILFIIICSVILGFGFGLFSSPNTNAIMSSVDKKFYGIASAMVSTMRMFGQTLSMGVVTIVFTVVIGNVHFQPGYYPLLIRSMKLIFTIFSILCFIGIFTCLGRGRLERD